MKKTKTTFVVTKEQLLKIFRDEKRPLALADLAKRFCPPKKNRKVLKETLQSMVRDGSITGLRDGRFGIPGKMNLMTGTLWCTKTGNGFLITDNQDERDIFIPSRAIKDAFHGDRIVARIEHTFRGKKEGKVIKITERNTKNVVGFVKRSGNLVYLVPEDERFTHHFVVNQDTKTPELKEGDLAAARITRFPEEGKDPECTIVKVLGGLDNTRTIIQFVQYKYNLPLRFKRSTDEDAKNLSTIPQQVLQSDRIDLRGTKHVTIDGEFAKDFDDAVCVEKTRTGYTLYVSIADVSHYVLPGSDLDKEAYARGSSVYFPGTVVPMLPKTLSNGLCSLNPKEDKFCLTVKLAFNGDGALRGTSFHTSIIQSTKRLTYGKVESALIAKEKKAREELGDVLAQLECMEELTAALAERRTKRGNLDFDLPEPEVILDMQGGIRDILRSERLLSHRIIEEFMIAANEAVAGFLTANKAPAIFRIHEPPEKEKLRDFQKLLNGLSIRYRTDSKTGLHLQSILESVKETKYEFLVNRTLLRSMKQAKYSASNKGHFGLASDSYLHFTSPIRRYPDLVCHRILKNLLNGGPGSLIYREEELEQMAIHLSGRERIAMELERETEDRLRILFMKDKVGEVYEGMISHVTSYGIFVELFDVFVEGIVLLSDLYDDYYLFQEDRFRLIGRRTRKIYRIGDKVRIRVVTANVEKNQLHFALL